jgi:signal peptidase I
MIAQRSSWTAARAALVADVLRSTPYPNRVVRLRVYGESMLPTLFPGDVVEIESCSPESLRPGEIVLAIREDRLFLHRLVSPCTINGFTLRGDSNPHRDLQFPVEALLGRMVRRVGDTNWITASALHPGPAAALFHGAGWLLCHWNLARRIVLKLHTRDTSGDGLLTLAQKSSEYETKDATSLVPAASDAL